jgi:hypothetical protein
VATLAQGRPTQEAQLRQQAPRPARAATPVASAAAAAALVDLPRVVFLPAVAPRSQVVVAPVAALLLVEMQPREGQRVPVAAKQPVARQPRVVGRVALERPRPAAPGHLAEA